MDTPALAETIHEKEERVTQRGPIEHVALHGRERRDLQVRRCSLLPRRYLRIAYVTNPSTKTLN